MNANSKQPAQTIDSWLVDATAQLTRAAIPSARLDAELMLCHMLGVERSWLIAHGHDSLAMSALSQRGGVRPGGIAVYGEKILRRRLNREPLAYIFGSKEFYGRNFIVNREVLVPRPETEALIELAKKHQLSGKLLDVGTGSGALGLTLWHELANVELSVSDISEEALEVAQRNAKKLKVSAEFIQSDLGDKWIERGESACFDVIAANLPYVDRTWERSPETKHEPALALFANDGGLDLIKQLIDQSISLLNPEGTLLLESDPEQQNDIILYGADHFKQIDRLGYGLLLQKRA